MLAAIRIHHFLRQELRRTSTPSLINWSFIWMRVIPLTFLTLVALIPTQYYINESRVDWLPLMAIILFLPRPILAIRTMFMGIQSIRQDMVQGRWELLILTGIPARKIVLSKWAKVVSQSCPDQILFILPTIGLAIGISQFFVSTVYNCRQDEYNNLPTLSNQIKGILSFLYSYCYNSDATYFAGHFHTLNPAPLVLIIGIILIVAIAIFEVGLNASIGTLAGFSQFAAKGLGIVYGAIIRFGLLLIVSLSIPLMEDYLRHNLDCGNFMVIRANICPNYPQSIFFGMPRLFFKGYDTIELAAMPLLDQGVLLAANIMRPSDTRLIRIDFYHFTYRAPRIDFIKNRYDNRPFVFRNLIAAAISGLFYWLLIRHFLRRATRFAIVNHGASGYLEL